MESLEILNQRLIDFYGSEAGLPNWRIVWSEDQFEKRLTHHDKNGFELLVPEMRELPKYKQWIHNKYILESLIEVPLENQHELTTKLSYEPIWIFEDKYFKPLPPKWEVCQFVIDTVYEKLGKKTVYKDTEGTIEARDARIKNLENELFGNETRIGDGLAHKSAVGFTKEN